MNWKPYLQLAIAAIISEHFQGLDEFGTLTTLQVRRDRIEQRLYADHLLVSIIVEITHGLGLFDVRIPHHSRDRDFLVVNKPIR